MPAFGRNPNGRSTKISRRFHRHPRASLILARRIAKATPLAFVRPPIAAWRETHARHRSVLTMGSTCDQGEHQADLPPRRGACSPRGGRSEEHTSELQSLMRISYAVFCLKKKKKKNKKHSNE